MLLFHNRHFFAAVDNKNMLTSILYIVFLLPHKNRHNISCITIPYNNNILYYCIHHGSNPPLSRTCTDFQVIWYDTSSCQFNGTAVSFYYTINHQYQPKQISLNHRMVVVVAQIPPIIINIPSLCPVKKNESKRISTFFNVTATFNYHPQPSFWLILSWTDCSIYPPESTRIIRYTSLSNITYHRLCGTAV